MAEEQAETTTEETPKQVVIKTREQLQADVETITTDVVNAGLPDVRARAKAIEALQQAHMWIGQING